jgi:hypothetical protein
MYFATKIKRERLNLKDVKNIQNTYFHFDKINQESVLPDNSEQYSKKIQMNSLNPFLRPFLKHLFPPEWFTESLSI